MFSNYLNITSLNQLGVAVFQRFFKEDQDLVSQCPNYVMTRLFAEQPQLLGVPYIFQNLNEKFPNMSSATKHVEVLSGYSVVG